MKLLSKSKTLLATLALAALAALAGGAQAAPVSVTEYEAGGVNYTNTVWAPSASYEGKAGAWRITDVDANTSFLAFCIEFLQAINVGVVSNYTSSVYSANANVQELYDRYYGTVLQSQLNAVGFQLALWDLSGQLDVASFVAPADAIAKANEFLDGVRTGTNPYVADQYKFIQWSNPDHQDLLQVLPADPGNTVPEPQTHALLLGGLGLMAMGMVSRRRKNK